MVSNVMRTALLFILAATFISSPAARAAVIASVDRSNVELNESFTLKIPDEGFFTRDPSLLPSNLPFLPDSRC